MRMKNHITEMFSCKVYREEYFVGEVEDVLIDVESKKMESIVVGKLNQQQWISRITRD